MSKMRIQKSGLLFINPGILQFFKKKTEHFNKKNVEYDRTTK